jgi:undecaprenyl-diphosphatase
MSFPSGHAFLSSVTFLTLGAVLAKFSSSPYTKAFLLTVFVMLAVLIGFSRIYIGVHWPTDVLAGWSAGFAWAILCWVGAYYLQRQYEC